MLQENKRMKDFLKFEGITAQPQYIKNGSLRGCWRLNGDADWWNSPKLWKKLNDLCFTDFDGKPLGKYSGNGGLFSIFARNEKLTKKIFNN